MMSWAEFKHLISTWTNVPVERLNEETDLTCDVGLDSLALEQVLTGLKFDSRLHVNRVLAYADAQDALRPLSRKRYIEHRS